MIDGQFLATSKVRSSSYGLLAASDIFAPEDDSPAAPLQLIAVVILEIDQLLLSCSSVVACMLPATCTAAYLALHTGMTDSPLPVRPMLLWLCHEYCKTLSLVRDSITRVNIRAHNSATMPTAVERAFGAPELLEMTLLLLPLEDLFITQRVDQSFKASIASSKFIRRKMWLEYEDPIEAAGQKVNTHYSTANPRLIDTLLAETSTELGNFGYREDENACWIRLEADLTTNPKIGVKPSQQRWPPSWLKMKATRSQMDVTIELKFRAGPGYMSQSSTTVEKQKCTMLDILVNTGNEIDNFHYAPWRPLTRLPQTPSEASEDDSTARNEILVEEAQ